MAQVIYSSSALSNLQRAVEHLLEVAPDAAVAAAKAIRSAVALLEQHPLIGRPIDDDLRELVISYGRTGYIALYRYLPARDIVRVLAIRHQRELDYP